MSFLEDDAAVIGEQADALLGRIMPLLAGQSDEVQAAVIADLAAIWIVGHHKSDCMREELIELHARHVRELVEMYMGDADG